MPTFRDPAVDAEESREALRGLAYASRQIGEPDETYRVLGSLSAGLLSLQQVLDQLAGWHEQHSERAVSEAGDRLAGCIDALTASGYLREAAGLVRQAHSELRTAFARNGRIAWRPALEASLNGRRARRPGSGQLTATPVLDAEAAGRESHGALGL